MIVLQNVNRLIGYPEFAKKVLGLLSQPMPLEDLDDLLFRKSLLQGHSLWSCRGSLTRRDSSYTLHIFLGNRER